MSEEAADLGEYDRSEFIGATSAAPRGATVLIVRCLIQIVALCQNYHARSQPRQSLLDKRERNVRFCLIPALGETGDHLIERRHARERPRECPSSLAMIRRRMIR